MSEPVKPRPSVELEKKVPKVVAPKVVVPKVVVVPMMATEDIPPKDIPAQDIPPVPPMTQATDLRRKASVWWIVATVVLLLVAALGFWFWWQEWMRFDDAQDIQDSWVVEATGAVIAIDDERIVIADDASYEYEMDSVEKHLAFSFLQLSGQARYRFSADRNTLIIVEGTQTDMLQLIMSELWWQISVVWAQITQSDPPDPAAEFLAENENSQAGGATLTITRFSRSAVKVEL